jgi:hypothetical protein
LDVTITGADDGRPDDGLVIGDKFPRTNSAEGKPID